MLLVLVSIQPGESLQSCPVDLLAVVCVGVVEPAVCCRYRDRHSDNDDENDTTDADTDGDQREKSGVSSVFGGALDVSSGKVVLGHVRLIDSKSAQWPEAAETGKDGQAHVVRDRSGDQGVGRVGLLGHHDH
jgi:hypothetical protein